MARSFNRNSSVHHKQLDDGSCLTQENHISLDPSQKSLTSPCTKGGLRDKSHHGHERSVSSWKIVPVQAASFLHIHRSKASTSCSTIAECLPRQKRPQQILHHNEMLERRAKAAGERNTTLGVEQNKGTMETNTYRVGNRLFGGVPAMANPTTRRTSSRS